MLRDPKAGVLKHQVEASDGEALLPLKNELDHARVQRVYRRVEPAPDHGAVVVLDERHPGHRDHNVPVAEEDRLFDEAAFQTGVAHDLLVELLHPVGVGNLRQTVLLNVIVDHSPGILTRDGEEDPRRQVMARRNLHEVQVVSLEEVQLLGEREVLEVSVEEFFGVVAHSDVEFEPPEGFRVGNREGVFEVEGAAHPEEYRYSAREGQLVREDVPRLQRQPERPPLLELYLVRYPYLHRTHRLLPVLQ